MRGADQCPRCGGDNVTVIKFRGDAEHAVCRDCDTAWEPFDPADLCVEGDTYGPFKHCCDNCAFRRGSPERADKNKWDDLMMKIHLGGAVFYCHKGVPVATPEEACAEGDTHMHPKKPDGSWDMKRMRECAGWLNTRLRAMYQSDA